MSVTREDVVALRDGYASLGAECDRLLALPRTEAESVAPAVPRPGRAPACERIAAPPAGDRVPQSQDVKAVAVAVGVSVAELRGPRRTQAMARRRFVAMLALRLLGWSFPALGRAFRRDHSTAIHACRKANEDPVLQAMAREAAGLPSDMSEPAPCPALRTTEPPLFTFESLEGVTP